MTGLILAGGRGTRLRPHTEEIPKPLLEINGKAILGHQIEILIDNNISPIIIVTGYLEKLIREYVHKNFPDHHFIFAQNNEYEHSRPAFGIIIALPLVKEYPVLYLNGDVFCEPNVIKRVINTPHSSATAIQKNIWDEEEVNVILNKDMSIKHISKNISAEESHGEFIGVTKLGAEFMSEIDKVIIHEGKEPFRYSFAIDLLNHIITKRDKKLFALDVTDLQAIEIDTPDDYFRAQKK